MKPSRAVAFGLLVSASLILTACSSFDLLEWKYPATGKSLAVISGLPDEATLIAANFLTESLEKNSRFKVLSQKQVAKAIPNYPQHIKGPYASAYIEVDLDYTRTDVTRLAEIQKQLGVDYLYVLWAPTATHPRAIMVNTANPELKIVAQCFEFPTGKEVGRGFYTARLDSEHNALMRSDLEAVAKEFAEKTGMMLAESSSTR